MKNYKGSRKGTVWNLEKCRDEARKYTQVTDWNKGSTYSYRVARKNGWFEECTGHFENWDRDRCIKDASQFKCLSDWIKGGNYSYRLAHKKGWFADCSAHMEKRKSTQYSKQDCLTEAAKYCQRTDWCKGHQPTYRTAQKNGWFQECINHMETGWTKAKCISDASLFSTRSQWSGSSPGYNVARYHGWLEECCGHMKLPAPRWDKHRCIMEAGKYKTRGSWAIGCPASVNAARKNGWFEECVIHMSTPPKKWTKEDCLITARQFDSRRKWQIGSPQTYQAVRRKGRESWLLECVEHMGRGQVRWNDENIQEDLKNFKFKGYWELIRYNLASEIGKKEEARINEHFSKFTSFLTKGRCLESANQFETCRQWHDGDPEFYFLALCREWFSDCTKHMLNSQFSDWHQLFEAEPIRFLHIYTNSLWDEAVWIGLNRPLGRRKKQNILENWPINSVNQLKKFGLKGKELARRRGQKKKDCNKKITTMPLISALNPCLEKPFLDESPRYIKCNRQAYIDIFGCDDVFNLVTNIIADRVKPSDFSISDSALECALTLVLKHKPSLLTKGANLRSCISISFRLKSIISLLKNKFGNDIDSD